MILEPYDKAETVTKSDTVNFVRWTSEKLLTDAIYVGGAGIVVAILEDDTAPQFTCIAGQVLPIAAKRINSTTTTATLMIALYRR